MPVLTGLDLCLVVVEFCQICIVYFNMLFPYSVAVNQNLPPVVLIIELFPAILCSEHVHLKLVFTGSRALSYVKANTTTLDMCLKSFLISLLYRFISRKAP